MKVGRIWIADLASPWLCKRLRRLLSGGTAAAAAGELLQLLSSPVHHLLLTTTSKVDLFCQNCPERLMIAAVEKSNLWEVLPIQWGVQSLLHCQSTCLKLKSHDLLGFSATKINWKKHSKMLFAEISTQTPVSNFRATNCPDFRPTSKSTRY